MRSKKQHFFFLMLKCYSEHVETVLNYWKLVVFPLQLDHAAKIKSTPEAEKYYAQTVSTLNDLLAKIG